MSGTHNVTGVPEIGKDTVFQIHILPPF